GDLRIMFESKEDDELWKNQEEWKLQSWIFYENCGVYVLRLEWFIEQQIDEFGGHDGSEKV
ncbi:hypothetical protein Tco_1077239, partial [Tanacetum coccineum]